MPNTSTTQSTTNKATAKQLAYLRTLAARKGTSFAYPQTKAAASAEIKRLQGRKGAGFSFAETSAAADNSDLALPNGANIQPHELTGYGSSATWSRS